MKNRSVKSTIFFVLVMAATALLLTGCFRKHIVSSPPAKRPAQETAPAPKPEVVMEEQKLEVIEETYVVDAPEEGAAPAPKVEEGELIDEPVVPPTEAAITESSPQAEAMKETVVEAEEKPVPAPMAEMYYVQVGAFSELENANNVLAGLIEEGYKGSKLVKTDSDMYRVQAGAFADEAAAVEALLKLQADYPKGFILKALPGE